jgi:hypothetical protein
LQRNLIEAGVEMGRAVVALEVDEQLRPLVPSPWLSSLKGGAARTIWWLGAVPPSRCVETRRPTR